jgi:hypothetical protein
MRELGICLFVEYGGVRNRFFGETGGVRNSLFEETGGVRNRCV